MRKATATLRKPPGLRVGIVRADGSVLDLGEAFDQVYSFRAADGSEWHWSVTEAKKRAEANSELGVISLSETGMTAEMVRTLYPDIDAVYALTTDLTLPILFVPFRGEHVLIDGWHRVFKAAVTGTDLLPCYLLSQEDADACLILTTSDASSLSAVRQASGRKRTSSTPRLH